MMPIADLSGQKFGKLTANTRFIYKKKSKWRCTCECGKSTEVWATHLIRNLSLSCGLCFGMPVKKMPSHQSWVAMKNRCLNRNHMHYHNYGGRGIEICQRWLDDFSSFHSDMGPRPDGTSLERIDSNGNYEPSNCVWATKIEQANNRRNNKFYEYQGRLMTVPQLARETGLKITLLESRVRRGKPPL